MSDENMGQQGAAAIKCGEYDRANDDAKIESQFITDYLIFGLQINWNCIRTLLEQARKVPKASLLKKSLCVSGLQVMYSSWEDFALLLHAIRARKESNKALHCTLGADKDSREGSTFMPKIYKRFRSSREVLDDLGFSNITLDRLREYGIEMNQAELDLSLQEFAASIKGLGDYQTHYNDIKNRLKHGKGVIGDYREDPKKADFITALDWHHNDGVWELTLSHHSASLQQLEIAAIHVGKLLIRSLDLLMFYAIQNHPEELKTLPRTIKKEGLRCASDASNLGLKSQGLTTLVD